MNGLKLTSLKQPQPEPQPGLEENTRVTWPENNTATAVHLSEEFTAEQLIKKLRS